MTFFASLISVNSPFGLRRNLDKAHKAILSQNINEHLIPPDMTRLSLPVCLHPASHCITLTISHFISRFTKSISEATSSNKPTHAHRQTQTHLYLKKGDEQKEQRENEYAP